MNDEHEIVKDTMVNSLVYLWCLVKYTDKQGEILPLTFESFMESPLGDPSDSLQALVEVSTA